VVRNRNQSALRTSTWSFARDDDGCAIGLTEAAWPRSNRGRWGTRRAGTSFGSEYFVSHCNGNGQGGTCSQLALNSGSTGGRDWPGHSRQSVARCCPRRGPAYNGGTLPLRESRAGAERVPRPRLGGPRGGGSSRRPCLVRTAAGPDRLATFTRARFVRAYEDPVFAPRPQRHAHTLSIDADDGLMHWKEARLLLGPWPASGAMGYKRAGQGRQRKGTAASA